MDPNPNCYAFNDMSPIASVRVNLGNIVRRFEHKQQYDCFIHTRDYGCWVHVERFWDWFKKVNRGGWTNEEQKLQSIVEKVTLHHYPEMDNDEIYEEAKRVLATFLFERGSMSVVEAEKLERFRNYLSDLLAVLE